MLTFDSAISAATVGVVITDDDEREVIDETVNLQLSFVEGGGENGILLLPDRAEVIIIDNDGWCTPRYIASSPGHTQFFSVA